MDNIFTLLYLLTYIIEFIYRGIFFFFKSKLLIAIRIIFNANKKKRKKIAKKKYIYYVNNLKIKNINQKKNVNKTIHSIFKDFSYIEVF